MSAQQTWKSWEHRENEILEKLLCRNSTVRLHKIPALHMAFTMVYLTISDLGYDIYVNPQIQTPNTVLFHSNWELVVLLPPSRTSCYGKAVYQL